MTKLPQVKPRDIQRVLGRLGFDSRSGKGSHMVYKHADGRRTVVPGHRRPVRIGTLKAILRQIDISADEFLKLLKRKE